MAESSKKDLRSSESASPFVLNGFIAMPDTFQQVVW